MKKPCGRCRAPEGPIHNWVAADYPDIVGFKAHYVCGGCVYVTDGARVDTDDPLTCIPCIAIELRREQNMQAELRAYLTDIRGILASNSVKY